MQESITFTAQEKDIPIAIVWVSRRILNEFLTKSRDELKYISQAADAWAGIRSIPVWSSCEVVNISQNWLIMLLSVTSPDGENHDGFVPTNQLWKA